MPLHNHVHHQHKQEAHRIRNAEPAQGNGATVVSVVYVTASKTFDGPIGGYKTMDGSKDDMNSAAPESAKAHPTTEPESIKDASSSEAEITKAHATQKSKADPAETASATSQIKAASASSSASKAVTTTPVTDSVSATSAHSTRASVPTGSSLVDNSAASGAVSATPTAVPTTESPGMSGGAKAGLAIGILLCIGVLLAVGFCCLRRNKKQKKAYEKTDDEKAQIGKPMIERTLSTQSTQTTATAPRLSLRPVTQFLPDLGSRRKSGNALATTGGPTQVGLHVPNEQYSEKPSASKQVGEATDPFGNHAEVSDKNVLPIQANTPTNPFGNHAATSDQSRLGSNLPPPAEIPAPLRVRTPTPEASNAAAAAAARAERHNIPNQHNLTPTRSASPAPSGASEYSLTVVSPGAFTHGPPLSSVHRIQLDFKPSMEDEIGLQAGQLVRLLHEYDDGWALCIRLDRSEQGVAPRTCLSARPVKPRTPGDRGPAPRGPPPPGMFGGPQQRPSSPASSRGHPNPYGRDPRSMSPSPVLRPVQRSMSPGPYGGGPQRPNMPPPGGKRRSNSASQVRERRNSPPGPSPMNPNANNMERTPLHLQAVTRPDQMIPLSHQQERLRKPVPGQAL